LKHHPLRYFMKITVGLINVVCTGLLIAGCDPGTSYKQRDKGAIPVAASSVCPAELQKAITDIAKMSLDQKNMVKTDTAAAAEIKKQQFALCDKMANKYTINSSFSCKIPNQTKPLDVGDFSNRCYDGAMVGGKPVLCDSSLVDLIKNLDKLDAPTQLQNCKLILQNMPDECILPNSAGVAISKADQQTKCSALPGASDSPTASPTPAPTPAPPAAATGTDSIDPSASGNDSTTTPTPNPPASPTPVTPSVPAPAQPSTAPTGTPAADTTSGPSSTITPTAPVTDQSVTPPASQASGPAATEATTTVSAAATPKVEPTIAATTAQNALATGAITPSDPTPNAPTDSDTAGKDSETKTKVSTAKSKKAISVKATSTDSNDSNTAAATSATPEKPLSSLQLLAKKIQYATNWMNIYQSKMFKDLVNGSTDTGVQIKGFLLGKVTTAKYLPQYKKAAFCVASNNISSIQSGKADLKKVEAKETANWQSLTLTLVQKNNQYAVTCTKLTGSDFVWNDIMASMMGSIEFEVDFNKARAK
jgi:hypothetical protein